MLYPLTFSQIAADKFAVTKYASNYCIKERAFHSIKEWYLIYKTLSFEHYRITDGQVYDREKLKTKIYAIKKNIQLKCEKQDLSLVEEYKLSYTKPELKFNTIYYDETRHEYINNIFLFIDNDVDFNIVLSKKPLHTIIEKPEYLPKTRIDYLYNANYISKSTPIKEVTSKVVSEKKTAAKKTKYLFETFIEFLDFVTTADVETLEKYIEYVDEVKKLPRKRKLQVFYNEDLSNYIKSTTWKDRFLNHFSNVNIEQYLT